MYLSFIVEADGSITHVMMQRGISGADDYNDKVIRLIKKMPKWNPGEQDGHPVRVQLNLPIHFESR